MPVGKLRWCGEAAVDSISGGLAQRSNKFPQGWHEVAEVWAEEVGKVIDA